ncbi:MAG: hypothetical protein OXU20_36120 [Myxococcales bacterium]|nr:hypothetical protein [Myxococcales bacterium]
MPDPDAADARGSMVANHFGRRTDSSPGWKNAGGNVGLLHDPG